MSIESNQKIRVLEQKTLDFPKKIHTYISLGQQYIQAGRPDAAEKSGKTAVKIDPSNQAGYFLLTKSLTEQNKLTQANKVVDQALQSTSETTELLAMASEVRYISGRLEEAESFLRRAITQSPRNTRLRFQFAHLILAQCRYAEAIDIFSELSKGCFFKDDALAGIAHAWERQGNIKKAHHYINGALKFSNTPSAFVLQTFADIAYQSNEIELAIETLLTGIRKVGLSAMDKAGLHFSLGKLLDKRCKFEQAFSHFSAANELLAPDYDWRMLGARCKTLIQKFSTDAVKSMPMSTVNSDKLVFIVGLPRSGTSLVERVLASHPDVHGAGELEHVHLIAGGDIKRITGSPDPGPSDFTFLGLEHMNLIATRYVDHLITFNKHAKHIIDKMPGNLMYLGLINALFPNARIIHCVRNPIDTCLSCYFQQFHRSNSLAYTFNLEALAYTWAQQEQLMSHWKTVLPISIMDVVYEELVNNFESTTESLLNFCDLDCHDSIHLFYKSDNTCHTASYAQVRKPLYTSSLNRWRNYEPYIQKLIDTLGSVDKPYNLNT